MKSYDKVKSRKNKNVFQSFKYGFIGLFDTIKRERNAKIGFLILIFLIIVSFILKLNIVEWTVILLACSLVIGFEMMNTALEATVDMAMPNIHPLARLAKDTAAGAVVFSVIMSFVIGCIIYIPKVIELFG